MKLIDADGIINVMKQQAGCATCDNYNGIICRACQWDDAITSIYDYADYHTVEAIPIEWIKEYIRTHPASTDIYFKWMIDEWKEEQEKQNDQRGIL